ncbi:MAG TPA: hypothetical protein VIP70_12445 [Nitrososphaeraceae archaeon]
MSLFPNEAVATKEIESWKGFADSLQSEEDRKLFLKVLNGCFKYAIAITAKGQPFQQNLWLWPYYYPNIS